MVWMALVVAVLAAAAAFLFLPARAAFEANLVFNAALAVVLIAGIVADFWQVAALGPSAHWVERVSRGFSVKKPPRAVAAVARVIAGREREGFRVSPVAVSSLLEGVRRRLYEGGAISRLLAGLLVVLTLAGALWALLDNRRDAALGTALFGLVATAALVLLNVLARQAQNRLLDTLEEFLAERTELPSAVLGGEAALPSYLEALLKQSAESLTEIQRMMVLAEEERRITQTALSTLTERLTELTDQLRAQQKVTQALSRNHHEIGPAVAELAGQMADAVAGSEEMRTHLRNLDVAVARLVEEVAAARTQTPEAVRREIRVLTQTLAPSVRVRQ